MLLHDVSIQFNSILTHMNTEMIIFITGSHTLDKKYKGYSTVKRKIKTNLHLHYCYQK